MPGPGSSRVEARGEGTEVLAKGTAGTGTCLCCPSQTSPEGGEGLCSTRHSQQPQDRQRAPETGLFLCFPLRGKRLTGNFLLHLPHVPSLHSESPLTTWTEPLPQSPKAGNVDRRRKRLPGTSSKEKQCPHHVLRKNMSTGNFHKLVSDLHL